jgi:hypothetical protein
MTEPLSWERRLDTTGDYFDSLIKRKEVDRIVLLFYANSKEHVSRVLRHESHLTRGNQLQFVCFEDLVTRRNRLASTAVLLCEHQRGTVGLHREPHYFVTHFQERPGVGLRRESYVQAILEAARGPVGPLTMIDLTQDWGSNAAIARHALVITALHAYQEAFSQNFETLLSVVRRHFVVSPRSHSPKELTALFKLVKLYVENSIEVSLSVTKSRSDASALSAVNNLVKRFMAGHEPDSVWHEIVAPERQSIAAEIRERGSQIVYESNLTIRSLEDLISLKDEL